MQPIKSFFAPAPYGTPWTTEQVKIIQAKQVNTVQYIKIRKTKLASKRLARMNAIAKLKKEYGSNTFTSYDIRKFLNFDHIQTNNFITYLKRNGMVLKVGKNEVTSSFIYQFTYSLI